MIRCDFSALVRCAGQVGRTAAGALTGLAAEAAEELVVRAADGTPVDTGRLRAGWRAGEAGDLTATVVNPVDYASFVEYGHRTRGGGGYVPGRFMLRDAVRETEQALPRLVEGRLERILGGAFGD